MKKNIIFTLSQVLISSVFTFATFGYIAQNAGLQLLGIWGVILSIGSVTRLSELGLSTAAIRYVAIENKKRNKVALISTIGTIFLTVLFVSISLMIFLILFSIIFDKALTSLDLYNVLKEYKIEILIGLAAASLSSVVCSSLDGIERFDFRVLSLLAGHFIMMLVSILGLNQFGLAALVYGLVAQSFVTLILSLILIAWSLRPLPKTINFFDYQILVKTTNYGVKLLGSSILIVLFEPITKIMLLHYGSLSIVGAFEIANQLVQKFRSLITGALQVLTPKFAADGIDHHAQSSKSGLYEKTFSIHLPILLHGMGAIILCSFSFAIVFAPDEAGLLSNMIVIVALSWLLNSAALPAYFYNIGSGYAGDNLRCFILMSLINILSGVLFGNLFGYTGVILGYGLALSTGGIFLLFYVNKNQNRSFLVTCKKLKVRTYTPFMITTIGLILIAPKDTASILFHYSFFFVTILAYCCSFLFDFKLRKNFKLLHAVKR